MHIQDTQNEHTRILIPIFCDSTKIFIILCRHFNNNKCSVQNILIITLGANNYDTMYRYVDRRCSNE